MSNFYNIYIVPEEGITKEQVEEKMNLALDWYRYDKKSYLVYTSSDEKKWKARLVNLVKPNGSLFICKVDVNDRQGWMLPKFWEWIRAKQSNV